MSGKTEQLRTYCIIGDPISHSLSPAIQNAAFSSLRLNCTYISLRVSQADLKATIESLRTNNISGFNVTVPHKVEVTKYLDRIEGDASKIGAVNTVNNEKGKFVGYNTDIDGFLSPLDRKQVSLNGANVLLLGAGGAARAVMLAIVKRGPVSKLIIANRSADSAQMLAKMGSMLGLNCQVCALSDACRFSAESEVIVNASSIGMHGEPSPIRTEAIRKGTIVYDIVYRPIYTPLIEEAKRAQAVIIFGYEMLLEQGALAFEIWTKVSAPREVMKKTLLGHFGEPT